MYDLAQATLIIGHDIQRISVISHPFRAMNEAYFDGRSGEIWARIIVDPEAEWCVHKAPQRYGWLFTPGNTPLFNNRLSQLTGKCLRAEFLTLTNELENKTWEQFYSVPSLLPWQLL